MLDNLESFFSGAGKFRVQKSLLLDRRAARRDDVDETEAGTAACSWIDIDETVAAYCKAQSKPVPEGIEDAVAVHIEAIEQWINQIQSRID